MTTYVPSICADVAAALGAADTTRLVRARDTSGRIWVRAEGEQGRRLADYWERVRQMWWGDGEEDTVTVRRPCTIRASGGRGKDAVWLEDELEALRRLPKLRAAIEELITQEPDLAQVKAVLAPWRTQVEDSQIDGGARQVVVEVVVPVHAVAAWPESLGGRVGPGELARVITIWAHYPQWEDKQIRRLRRIAVDTLELWPQAA